MWYHTLKIPCVVSELPHSHVRCSQDFIRKACFVLADFAQIQAMWLFQVHLT